MTAPVTRSLTSITAVLFAGVFFAGCAVSPNEGSPPAPGARQGAAEPSEVSAGVEASLAGGTGPGAVPRSGEEREKFSLFPFGKKEKGEEASGERSRVAIPSPIPASARADAAKPPKERFSLRRALFFWWPKPKPRPPVAQALVPVAKVYLINIPGKFAVLESANWQQLTEGKELSATEAGAVRARVRVTADRRPPFAVAEILEGSLQRGDSLYEVVIDP